MARRRNHGKRNNLTRTFLMLSEKIKDETKKVLIEGAEMVVNDAKNLVPVKTGDLKNSITYSVNKNGTSAKISAPAKNKDGIAYGQYVEFWPGREHPFLYPAMDINRKKIKDMIADALRGAIK